MYQANIKLKTNAQLMELRDQLLEYNSKSKNSNMIIIKDRLDVIEKEIRSRTKNLVRANCGNALVLMEFVPKKTKEDIIVVCVLKNIYRLEELHDKGYIIPRDENGKIIWLKK